MPSFRWMGKRRGGAAIEYIIVSTFATAISVAAVMFIGKLLREKLSAMSEKLGIDVGELDLDPFADE